MKRRMILFTLCIAMLIPAWTTASARIALPAGVPRPFFIEQAQNIALARDPAIKRKNNQLTVKRMKYVESVEAIKAKIRNLRAFRWTPLLSFKFPQKLDLIKEYEMTVKPVTLRAEITVLTHERDDLVYETKRRVGILFTDIFIYQERIAFTELLLELAHQDLARSSAKLLLGTALQADIDTMEKSIEKQTGDLAALKRSFENAKKNLSDMLGLDVTTGYRFKNPLKTASITREQLESLVDYTLANDHVYYSMRMAESVALLNLDSYESLFRSQYGNKVNVISVFLNQARNGQEIDKTAFKEQYDAMLKSFDQPWDGRLRILFFTFTKEWIKGEVSGTRYVEEEMYALYTAALEYQNARRDKEQAERALRRQIADEYESLVTAKNAVDSLLKLMGDARTALARVLELNRRGKATYAEVKEKQDDYQAMQLDAVEALAEYNELLFSFDRLTCGAVTKLLSGAGLDMDAGAGGESNADLPIYYIYTDIADMVFVFGVSIPDGFEPDIDSFEIYYEGTQIGPRTPVGREIRHLAIDYGETGMLTVRLFNGDDYVDECVIDTTIPTDVLRLRGAVRVQQEETILGTYTITTEQRMGAATSEVTLSLLPGAGARYYRISLDGLGLYTGDFVPVDQPFHYLTLLVGSIETVRIELYNEDRQALFTARFEIKDQSIREIID
jgi:hypothetical protein